MSKETIGPKIKAFRKGRGITQTQLAEALGYSHKSVITHIEKGESEMSYEKILLLLRTYAVDANDLFGIERIDDLLEEHRKIKKVKDKENDWMKDILFDVDGQLFSYRVGGALIKDNKILLTKNKKGKYSLPGGHVQIGESSKETIVREFKEETGLNVEAINVISTLENFWDWNNKKCHQICIFYKLKLINDKQQMNAETNENGTAFVWLDLKELKDITLYPIGIGEQILNDVVDKTHYIVK